MECTAEFGRQLDSKMNELKQLMRAAEEYDPEYTWSDEALDAYHRMQIAIANVKQHIFPEVDALVRANSELFTEAGLAGSLSQVPLGLRSQNRGPV